ncbi:MAG TPA: DUF882 domain-containing protein [Steroidobacteraceae bacterium]|nr:DUF882 domain-containing protein [Steroidobacteraceae bacterium]
MERTRAAGAAAARTAASAATRRAFLLLACVFPVSLLRAPRAQAAAAPLDWLELHNTHTDETLRITFRNAAGFIPAALARLDRILFDHRSGEHRAMDPQLFVLLADLAAAAGVEPRYEIISGYRSAATNERLRLNGGGQAKQSQHIQGKAIDVRLKGVSTERLRDLAVALGRGGVGYYPKSDFVHVDTARVRYWEG